MWDGEESPPIILCIWHLVYSYAAPGSLVHAAPGRLVRCDLVYVHTRTSRCGPRLGLRQYGVYGTKSGMYARFPAQLYEYVQGLRSTSPTPTDASVRGRNCCCCFKSKRAAKKSSGRRNEIYASNMTRHDDRYRVYRVPVSVYAHILYAQTGTTAVDIC